MITINQVKATAFYTLGNQLPIILSEKQKNRIIVVAYHNTSKHISKVKKRINKRASALTLSHLCSQ